jgi:hypothetical protein
MESFEQGEEIVRVYLAGSLAEAQAVERALAGAGLEYGVEVEDLPSRSVLLSAARRGVGFWVATAQVDAAAGTLERARLVSGLVVR